MHCWVSLRVCISSSQQGGDGDVCVGGSDPPAAVSQAALASRAHIRSRPLTHRVVTRVHGDHEHEHVLYYVKA